MSPPDLSVERAALRERFRQAQLARMEVILSGARIIKDIAQSRELMAQADFLLTMPYLKWPTFTIVHDPKA